MVCLPSKFAGPSKVCGHTTELAKQMGTAKRCEYSDSAYYGRQKMLLAIIMR